MPLQPGRSAALCAVLLAFASAAAAGDRWTEFRGPSGTGHSDSKGLPREWSEEKNVAWRTRIHGRGWSSPGVLGKQVWLTTAIPEGHELSVLALDRDDGRVLFDVRVFRVERPEDTRQYNSFASRFGEARQPEILARVTIVGGKLHRRSVRTYQLKGQV